MEPWYRFAVFIVRPFVRTAFRCDFLGQHNLPPQGGCIIAPNHISYVDPLVLALFLHDAGRRPRFLGKASIFKIPLVGRILRGARQIPVYRETADAASALRAAIAAVQRGECVVVYPEGTITRDPGLWPMTGKTGIARLELATGAPVVPVGMWGPQDLLPFPGKRLRLFPRKRAAVRAGTPVDLSPWEGLEPSAEVLREMTDAVLHSIAAVVGSLRGEAPPATLFADGDQRDQDERRSA